MVKLSRFAKIRENRESFPPRMFCRIRYISMHWNGDALLAYEAFIV